ncbi:hypothetical protein [Vibrio tapetis]|nr:hypothetical protein [Vibrio tapetis]
MQKFVVALLCTTIVAMVLYFLYGQSKSFVLKPTDYTFNWSDDSQSGGSSVSSLSIDEQISSNNNKSVASM